MFESAWGGLDADELRERLIDYDRDLNLLLSEAERRGLVDSEGQAQESLDAFKRGFANPGELDRILDERGITEDELTSLFERTVMISLLARDLVGEDDVTDEQLAEYYLTHKANYDTNPSKRISHILFAPEDGQTATEVASQLAAGADFASLAEKHSLDRVSAANGGDIGFSTGTYPESFQEAVDMLGVGQISEPIPTKYGIHLVLITEVKDASGDFESVKDRLKADLLSKLRGQAIEMLLDQLKGGRS